MFSVDEWSARLYIGTSYIRRGRAPRMSDAALPLVEPDLVGVWRKNVWWFGFRWPFSMVLFSWVTVASTLAPQAHLARYLLTMVAVQVKLGSKRRGDVDPGQEDHA